MKRIFAVYLSLLFSFFLFLLSYLFLPPQQAFAAVAGDRCNSSDTAHNVCDDIAGDPLRCIMGAPPLTFGTWQTVANCGPGVPCQNGECTGPITCILDTQPFVEGETCCGTGIPTTCDGVLRCEAGGVCYTPPDVGPVVVNAGCNAGQTPTLDCMFPLIANVVSWLLMFAGVLAVFLVIFAGIRLTTSGGDPKTVEGGKKTLTFAIAGLVLILLSFLILNFVGDVTGLACIKPSNPLSFSSCQ